MPLIPLLHFPSSFPVGPAMAVSGCFSFFLAVLLFRMWDRPCGGGGGGGGILLPSDKSMRPNETPPETSPAVGGRTSRRLTPLLYTYRASAAVSRRQLSVGA